MPNEDVAGMNHYGLTGQWPDDAVKQMNCEWMSELGQVE